MHYFHDHYSEMMPIIFLVCIVGIIFGVVREMRWLSVFFTVPLIIIVFCLISSNLG
ncbi:Uncharacterised protein [Proteus vulgaris]|nr:hypothetical protein BN1805_01678 [Proteus vulgaris]SUC18854.1 Uncharacterised protein [Proteus vulgaris]